MEQTFVMVKPDGVQRGLVGEIVARLERRGLKLVGAKFMRVSQELAAEHYAELKDKPFYPGLIDYITSSPVLAMAWEGRNAVAAVRQTLGATKPSDAAPGTIRHDYGMDVGRNLTHGSDSPKNGAREVALWFKPDELVTWDRATDAWIFE